MKELSTFCQIKITLFFLLALVCFSLGVSCGSNDEASKKLAEEDQQYKNAEERAYAHIYVSPISLSAPIGGFLLLRKGTDVCALRFTNIQRGGDAKPPTPFHSGEESTYAEYDWFYQGDGSSDLTKPNVKSGHSKLSKKATVGFFVRQLAWPRGDPFVRCGPLRLEWSYPSHVYMTNAKGEDLGFEIAPTKWKEISEINVRDTRLKWYRYDEKRGRTYIPVDTLW